MPRVLQYSDVENAYDDPERIARLAGSIGEHNGSDCVVVGTGDNLAPGVCSLVTRGGCARPFFEAVDAAVETFGNHDFDYGIDRVLELVDETAQQWVSANIERSGDPFGTEVGVRPYEVLDVGGRSVAFIGVTDPETVASVPATRDLTITDPIEAVDATIRNLPASVEFVCVLSHCGALDDGIARQCDVDAVLGGHVHDERIERIADTICTRPNAGGHRICAIDLEADTAEFHPTESGPIDGRVEAIYEALVSEIGLGEVVARVEQPIERTRERRLGGECRAGNFVADAYRWAAGTDCGLHNAGGLRDGPALAGAVQVADLVSLVPFDERVVRAAVTGRELRAILEAANVAPHGEAGWSAHVSGLEVLFDRAAGRLLECRVGGESLDFDRTYTLATSAYLLASTSEFEPLTPAHCRERLAVQWQVLAAYARTEGIDPRIEGRLRFRDGTAETGDRDENRNETTSESRGRTPPEWKG